VLLKVGLTISPSPINFTSGVALIIGYLSNHCYAVSNEIQIKIDGAIVIPAAVVMPVVVVGDETVVDFTFINCSGLTSVTIPNSVIALVHMRFILVRV
jgi:hypothetical protein